MLWVYVCWQLLKIKNDFLVVKIFTGWVRWMLKNVIITPYVMGGIGHNHSSFPDRFKMFSADTETVRGEPMTLQIYDGNKDREVFFKWVSRGTVLDTFLEYLESNILRGKTNVVYFHNLSFDLSVLLIQYHKLYAGRRNIEIVHKAVHGSIIRKEYLIKAVITTPCFADIRFYNEQTGKHDTTVKLLDSMSFVHGSLEYIAEQLQLPHRKLGHPVGLGEVKFTDKDDYFVRYAKNDVLVQYELAEWIVAQYKRYRTKFCVSVAQFASRVFKHYHIRSFENIRLPPKSVVEASLLSYHGGKNGFYTDGITVMDDCVEVDITSAYPYAMRSTPNFLKGEYRKVENVKHGLPDEEGVYCITGEVVACKYPVLYTHDFKPLPPGPVESVWVTSYELREALSRGEFVMDKARTNGWIWVPDKTYKHNPMIDYVDEFFSKKNTAGTWSEREVYKLLLNSLYGKFIQSIEVDNTDPDLAFDFSSKSGTEIGRKQRLFKAGGLFNPFIATLITGFTRVHLHKLEHQFKAYHASTDSVKLLGKNFVPHTDPKSLGGYKLEVRGPCIMLRNKLYLHYEEGTGKLKKYALHGFAGKKEELFKLFTAGTRGYLVKHLLKVKEAMKRTDGLAPLAMHELKRSLDVDFSKIRHIDKDGAETFYTHEAFMQKFKDRFMVAQK